MDYSFDELADRYISSTKKLPQKYIDLILNEFGIKSKNRVLDLGCGNGLLTFPISEVCKNVVGLDISLNMIANAKKKDITNTIKWIQMDVLKYSFPYMYYDLIITYESIHLFPNIESVVKKCEKSLKSGGFLCMGWCYYNWELVIEKEIVDIFNKYGVIWGEWSYQKFEQFSELIKFFPNFSQTKEKHISVYEEWSTNDIVNYITSISKVLDLDGSIINSIKQDLENVLRQKYGDCFIGNTEYCIRYSQKG